MSTKALVPFSLPVGSVSSRNRTPRFSYTRSSKIGCFIVAKADDADNLILSGGNDQPSKSKTPGDSGVSFGKLKAHRVRAIVTKTSKITQKEEEEEEDDILTHSSSILESMRNKIILGARQTHATDQHQTNKYNSRHSDSETNQYIPRHSNTETNHRDSTRNYRDRFVSNKRSSQDTDFFSRKSFTDLGLSDFMIQSLNAQHFQRPSNIQALAFGSVLHGKSCVIADQSGSGKTLAFLVPVIQRLREEELNGLAKASPGCPRVVILVPTAELASQVLDNCRSMSKFGVPFRSMVVTGGFRQRTQLETLQQGVDVLIATPGRFMYLIKEGFLNLTNLRCAVLDEVDILFKDEDFEVALQSLINSSPVAVQYLFVTATLPLEIYNKLVEVFPDCEVIMGPGMHRTSPGLEEVLVDCSGDNGTEKTPETAFLNKKNALLQLVGESPVSKTIIFCNKIETCRKVENALKRNDRKGAELHVLPFHAAVAQELRVANMKKFTSRPEGDSLFLVCTDRASRGIDFSGVDHVVLFDFPRDPSEYVRRVGRTARGAGGKGKAFIFVVGKQVSLALKIIERNQKGHPLHDVPSAYEFMT